MRPSTILSIVALATAAPSLAAPVFSAPQHAKRQSASLDKSLFAREFNEQFTRELIAREDDQSGAFWGLLLRAAPTIINAVSGLFSGNKRELSAREFEEQFVRELIAREDDQSGAFWGLLLRAAPTIINAVSGLFGGNKREVEELLARGFEEHFVRELMTREDDQSGAFWGLLLRAVPTIVNAVSGLFNGNKRELEELFTREFEEHYARELVARDGDESGAFWGALVRAIPSVISTVSGLFGGNKREVEELLTREFQEHYARELIARDGDESGAFWSLLLRAAPTIINAVSGLFSGNKREFEELLARASFEARSLNELD